MTTEKKREYHKAWYKANKVRILAKQRVYYEANREKVAAYHKAWHEANRDERRAKQKAYREANKWRVAAMSKAWREANREKVVAMTKSYQEANKEKIAVYGKAYYEANREKMDARSKAWHKANPETIAACQANTNAARRAQKLATEVINCPRVKAIYFIASWLRSKGDDVHVDHIIPLSRGGTHTHDNLQILTATENLSKGAT